MVVSRPLKLLPFDFPMKGSEEFAPFCSSQIMRTFNKGRKRRNLKETVFLRRRIITWPTLGKQNKQAGEFYCANFSQVHCLTTEIFKRSNVRVNAVVAVSEYQQ